MSEEEGFYIKDGCTGDCYWCFYDERLQTNVCVPCDCPKEISKIKKVKECLEDDVPF